MARQPIDMKGIRYGNLVGIEKSGKNVDGHIIWLFQCDCGKQKTIIGNDVRQKKVVSCGCYHKKIMKKNKHRISK